MSFFKKLKDRLFKSSKKIEEGLDAIIEDGGVEEQLAVEIPPAPAPDPEPDLSTEPTAVEPAPEPEVPAGIPAKLVDASQAPAIKAEAVAEVVVDAILEPEPVVDEVVETEVLSPEPEPEPAMPAGTADEPVGLAQENTPETVPTPAAQPDPPVTPAAMADVASGNSPITPIAPALAALDAETIVTPSKKPGLMGRLLGRKETKTVLRRELDDAMLESLEELLIAADMGVDTALRVTANMAEGRFGKKLSANEIKQLLANEITRIMDPIAKPMPLYPKTPQVVLVVGVNGSGKTTTIGKLAAQFRAAGKTVIIAAGDTFRAAAVEQLQVWGDRAGVPVLTAPEGSDPASLAFQAMEQAKAEGVDLLMIDTAGRLQNRADLMEELSKIIRVIRKQDETAPHNTLLVLDATTGQNALNQVEVFQKISDVSGLVMTKLDGTAKGGVLVALADRFALPIHAIGVGEQIDDLAPFDPEDFANALTGLGQ